MPGPYNQNMQQPQQPVTEDPGMGQMIMKYLEDFIKRRFPKLWNDSEEKQLREIPDENYNPDEAKMMEERRMRQRRFYA